MLMVPIATTKISANLVISFKFSVFECAIVTVASLFKNIIASGLPTILNKRSFRKRNEKATK